MTVIFFSLAVILLTPSTLYIYDRQQTIFTGRDIIIIPTPHVAVILLSSPPPHVAVILLSSPPPHVAAAGLHPNPLRQ